MPAEPLRLGWMVPRHGRPQQHGCPLQASLWQEVQGKLPVLAFSALPFLSVQALADSGLGKRLRVRRGPALRSMGGAGPDRWAHAGKRGRQQAPA